MTPVVIFVAGVAASALLDSCLWSQISWVRNVPIPTRDKVPFLFRPALTFDLLQVARWLGIGALISGCNIFRTTTYYVPIFVATMIFCAFHLALSTAKYWRMFSAEVRRVDANS